MKTIVTHISPDLDAISAVWLIRRFLPGWHDAKIEFVPAGMTLDKQSVDENPNFIHVDTGLGRFDHHQNDQDTCSAKKVYFYLKHNNLIKNKLIKPLERMIEVINDIDHFREVFLPNPDKDIYDFLVIGVLDGLRMKFQNDLQLAETGELLLDGILNTFINKIQAEQEIKTAFVFKIKLGKVIALESDNEESSRLAQKKGYLLVIRKSPKKGHLRIKLLPRLLKLPQPNGRGIFTNASSDLKSAEAENIYPSRNLTHAEFREGGLRQLDLSVLYNQLKRQDPQATWYFHPSGQMILNGTSKNPNTVPTKLTLHEVINIVKKIK